MAEISKARWVDDHAIGAVDYAPRPIGLFDDHRRVPDSSL